MLYLNSIILLYIIFDICQYKYIIFNIYFSAIKKGLPHKG
nr:MAG TPA: hypothetical protein [Caudoviricetes sp.]